MMDAVIVGAGISGLHAAWRLQQAGRKVLVCEARDRVGGRLVSVVPSNATAPVDLGATWIWREEQQVMALTRELGISTYPHHEDGALLYDLPSGPQPVEGEEPGRTFLRVIGGTAAIPEALFRELREETVLFGTKVERIARDRSSQAQEQEQDHSLNIEFSDRPPVRTRHVILALPPSLALSAIEFSPHLPEDFTQLALATPVWMGNIVKTIVVYDSPFWRDAGFSGTVMSALGPMQEIHDISGPDGAPAALFGFTGLPHPNQAPPSREAVLAQLTRLFGSRASQVQDFVQMNWLREPLTSPPEQAISGLYHLFGHRAFAQPCLRGRLHFCSCETSGVGGHIEDALRASSRAVEAVLKDTGELND